MRKFLAGLLVAMLILLPGCVKRISVCPEPLAIPERIILRLEVDGTDAEWNWLNQYQKQQEMLLP